MGQKAITITLPEELAALLEEDELLKSMAESLLADELRELLLKVLVLDKLAEGSEFTEDDVAELDRRVKKGLRLRIEAQINGRHK